MQQQSAYNSSEAARLLGVNNTTIQRAIARGDLAATRYRDRSPFQIDHAALFEWAGKAGLTVRNGNNDQVSLKTGEVLEDTAAAAYESAQLGPMAVVDGEVTPLPAMRVTPNVSRVLLPSADAGLLEACRRLVALPESPQLWQALRAVLGVEVGQ